MSKPAYPPSDHCDGDRFFNPGGPTDKSLSDVLRWRRTSKRVPWPTHVANPPASRRSSPVPEGCAAFTFIGHSTYLIEVGGFCLITDPVFADRASPLSFAGPKRVRAPGLALTDLPRLDAVLLSHNHYDHMDLASLRALAARGGPTIVTGLGNGRFLERRGIGPAVELDWWDSTEIKPGLTVTYVPAQHWSSRGVADRRRMLWGGHMLGLGAGRVYVAGDTGYFAGFRAIRERLGAPQVAILPIGAYEPRWFMRDAHMNPEEAVLAHGELGAWLSLAAHWGTFQLTDEGIDQPVLALDAARRASGVDDSAFQSPLPGETVMARLGP